MKPYLIKSHPTIYNGVKFRSRLEARWAAFFDLVGWKWEYESIDLNGWTPDFRVSFHCGHSECKGNHTLLIEIKPYFSIDDFDGHPCMRYPYGGCEDTGFIPADASAAFGASPNITYWEMAHGAGGGVEEVTNGWAGDDVENIWKIAGQIVQFKPTNN